jgi:hypothetical protein
LWFRIVRLIATVKTRAWQLNDLRREKGTRGPKHFLHFAITLCCLLSTARSTQLTLTRHASVLPLVRRRYTATPLNSNQMLGLTLSRSLGLRSITCDSTVTEALTANGTVNTVCDAAAGDAEELAVAI